MCSSCSRASFPAATSSILSWNAIAPVRSRSSVLPIYTFTPTERWSARYRHALSAFQERCACFYLRRGVRVIRFADREEAGRRLAAALEQRGVPCSLVAAIARGGVIVAAPVAAHLGVPLVVVVVRKVGVPGNPELAAGAVAPGGEVLFNTSVCKQLGLSEVDLQEPIRLATAELERRLRAYGAPPPERLDGEAVVVVDDGLATGFTAEAALRALRKAQPRRLTLAVPVGVPATVRRLQGIADEVICLHASDFLRAVSQYYERFEQVDDRQVIEVLRRFRPNGDGERSSAHV